MLVQWAWLDYAMRYLGDYQSDTDDLKAFLRRYSRQIYALYCKRQDDKEYIWRNPLSFEHGGWIRV